MTRFTFGVIAAVVAAFGVSLAASVPAEARDYHRMRDSYILHVPDKVVKPPKGHQTMEQWEANKKNDSKPKK